MKEIWLWLHTNNNLCSSKLLETIPQQYQCYFVTGLFVLMLHKLLGVWRWCHGPAVACWSGTSEAAPCRAGHTHCSPWGRVHQEYNPGQRSRGTSQYLEGEVWEVSKSQNLSFNGNFELYFKENRTYFRCPFQVNLEKNLQANT